MKLLREFYSPHETDNLLVEQDGEKHIRIKGIFAQSNLKNKNGRYYSEEILDRELYKLQKQIAESKLTGELDHPEKPEIILKNAAIKIESLKKDKANYVGEAKIMKSTPNGAIAWGLAKEGIKFGTSTRGLGTLEEKEGISYVKEDYSWLTNDLVADPSAPDAWVESILEQADWYIENGYIKENVVETYKNKLHKLSKEELSEGVAKMFQEFLNDIKV